MRQFVKTLSILATLLFAISCDRSRLQEEQAVQPITSNAIEEAKSYYNRHLHSPSATGGRSGVNRAAAVNKTADWNKAVTYKFRGQEVVEVPLLYNGREAVYSVKSPLFPGEEAAPAGVTKALFFKKKGVTSAVYIMKLAIEKGYYEGKASNNEYKNLSLSNLKKDFTGFLVFSNWEDKVLSSYKYKNGKIVAWTEKGKARSKNGRVGQCYDQWHCRVTTTCVFYGCCTQEEENYNPTGYCCDSAPNPSCWTEEECWNVGTYCEPDPEPTQPEATIDVEKQNLQPCNNHVYDHIVNTNLPSKVIDIVKSFAVSQNLTVVVADEALGGGSLDAEARQLNANTWQITLNTDVLANATQEYIAATILHEMLHVYLGTSANDADHEVMSQQYVNPMANALVSMGYNISYERAVALAWGGLQETNAWRQMVDQDRVAGTHRAQDIINTNVNYRAGVLGRSCQ